MAGVGLIEGGTPLNLDLDTVMQVSNLMIKYLSPARSYALAVAGLLIVSIGILVALLADQANYRQASYVFLLTALAFMAGAALLLGPSILTILFRNKEGRRDRHSPTRLCSYQMAGLERLHFWHCFLLSCSHRNIPAPSEERETISNPVMFYFRKPFIERPRFSGFVESARIPGRWFNLPWPAETSHYFY